MSASPRPRIPSFDSLGPLPKSAARLAELIRDWLPCEPAAAIAPASGIDAITMKSEIVYTASVTARLARQVEQETSPASRGWRWSRWENALVVRACFGGLRTALEALLNHLGWGGLWGADGYSMMTEGCLYNGVPVAEAEPPPGTAFIVARAAQAPVPLAMLEQVELAAGRLWREMAPTLEQIAAEMAANAEPAPAGVGGAIETAPPAPDPPGGWTKPDSIRKWAKVYGWSRNTMTTRLAEGAYRSKKVGRLYQIAVADLPENEKPNHLPKGNE